MNTRHAKKLVHVGDYVAEVDICLIEDESGWSPTISLTDARKLDTVRRALQAGDLKKAGELGNIFRLTPVLS